MCNVIYWLGVIVCLQLCRSKIEQLFNRLHKGYLLEASLDFSPLVNLSSLSTLWHMRQSSDEAL